MQCSAYVKDMYIIPLLNNEPIPPQIMPFDGPGNNDNNNNNNNNNNAQMWLNRSISLPPMVDGFA